ncbi:MAG: hypothetical protein HPY61_05205 [Methanotrichaceae archaeon]|nr:hypothetical protein [Methanotrichaceae archaeon]
MPEDVSAKPAHWLFTATILTAAAGTFFGIFFLFISAETAIRVATALMVGVVGILSFLRHSIFYRSDQVRMNWMQENPQFQIEVGIANLSIGTIALVVSLLDWGAQACGITLMIYGLYILLTLVVHARDALHSPEKNKRPIAKIGNSALFALILFGFAFFALQNAGA